MALTGTATPGSSCGDGKGFFTRETATGIPPFVGGCTGYYVRLADLDGDGKDEIVADFAGENSAMFDPDRCPSGGESQAWHLAPAGRRPWTVAGSGAGIKARKEAKRLLTALGEIPIVQKHKTSERAGG